jgi:hypothetical protein
MARSKTSGQGRPKGVPNKTTVDVREAIGVFAKAHVEEMSVWLGQISDPAKRLDLYLRALEYHVPKLGRTEITGANGEAFQVVIQGADSAL